MRILYITTHLNPVDGYGRYGRDLILEMLQRGHDVCAVVESASNDVEVEQHELLGTPVLYWINIWNAIQTARRVNVKIRQYKPDIVHIIVEPYATLLPFLPIQNERVILTVHGTFAYIPKLVQGIVKKIVSYILTRLYYSQVDVVITPSRYTKKYLLEHVSSIAEKINVITNGITISAFPKREEVQKSTITRNILFVGAIKKRKGLYEALEGLVLYLKEHPAPVIFTIVGKYDESHAYYIGLQKLIERYAISDSVVFRGRVSHEDLIKEYQGADVFLMTSIMDTNGFEGYGLVYLEANTYGIPTIGSIESGAMDAIAEGVSGYLVDPRKPEAIASALHNILDMHAIDPDDCVKWAKYNSVEKMVDKYLLLYD